MPTYRYACPEGHEEMVWRSIKEATVWEIPCGCGRVATMHMASPAIAADALPVKGHAVRAVNAREKRWDKDMPAYYRLRKEGLHPKAIDGAHLAEQSAKDPLEVNMGRPLGEHLGAAKEAAAALAQNDPAAKGKEIGEALRGGKPVPV